MSLRPGGFSLRPGGGGGFDEDERGGSFRPSGGSRPRSELDDRMDNHGDRRSKGSGGRHGAGGGGRNSDDVLEGQLFLGEVVSLRESDRFGFIQPDAASGLPRTGALPLLPPPPPAAAASAAAACTRAARAHAPSLRALWRASGSTHRLSPHWRSPHWRRVTHRHLLPLCDEPQPRHVDGPDLRGHAGRVPRGRGP